MGSAAVILLLGAGLKGVARAADTSGGQTHFVVIFDGDNKRVAETAAQNVAEAIRAFRLDLAAGDIVEPALTTDITVSPFYINIYRANLESDVMGLLRSGRSPLDDRVRAAMLAWTPSLPEPEKPTVVAAIKQVVKAKPAYQGTPDKEAWLAAAGVPATDWPYADYIIFKESSWNPRAVNASSGACGLVQAFPCSKLGPNWDDPVVAITWQHNYVRQRYGGYEAAYNFWTKHHWY